MFTISMRASVVGESEVVTFVSKRTAFLLRGKERKELPLLEGVAIVCGRKAEGVLEGAADRGTEGVLDGLRRNVGG